MATVKSIPTATHRDYMPIDLALMGDQQAYRALFKRYWKRLFFTVNTLIPDREEAGDVTMEAFSKAFDTLHRFRKDYNFNTWLYRVAIDANGKGPHPLGPATVARGTGGLRQYS
jgi:hypothetical protein